MAIMKRKEPQKKSTDDLLRELISEVKGMRSDAMRVSVMGGTIAMIGPRGLPDSAVDSLTEIAFRVADRASAVK